LAAQLICIAKELQRQDHTTTATTAKRVKEQGNRERERRKTQLETD